MSKTALSIITTILLVWFFIWALGHIPAEAQFNDNCIDAECSNHHGKEYPPPEPKKTPISQPEAKKFTPPTQGVLK